MGANPFSEQKVGFTHPTLPLLHHPQLGLRGVLNLDRFVELEGFQPLGAGPGLGGGDLDLLSGCYGLSNLITIQKIDVFGGLLESSLSSDIVFCTNDGMPDMVENRDVTTSDQVMREQ